MIFNVRLAPSLVQPSVVLLEYPPLDLDYLLPSIGRRSEPSSACSELSAAG